MKRPALVFTAISLCGLGLAGCSAPNEPSSYLKSAAQAVLVARAYDRGDFAAREGNTAQIEEAVSELRKLGAASEAQTLVMRAPLTPAEEEVETATLYDMLAARQKGADKERSSKQSAIHYRKALQLQPNFSSVDPDKLNALGYFLAERGTSSTDFSKAEILTRQALALFDEQITEKTKQGADTKFLRYMRSNTRDSVAWALYRRGRFTEALKEQRQAVKEAEDLDLPVSPELTEHLVAILKAAGKDDEALEHERGLSKPKPITDGGAGVLMDRIQRRLLEKATENNG